MHYNIRNVVVATYLLLFPAATIWAQAPPPSKLDWERAAESLRKDVCKLAVRQIDELQRVCELSVSQTKEVEACAATVTEQYVAIWLAEKLRQFSLKDDALNATWDDAHKLPPYSHGRPRAFLARIPLWREGVDRVLTLEQKAAYHELQEERRQLEWEIAIRQLMLNIDYDLLLSRRQFEQLQLLIDKKLAAQVTQSGDALAPLSRAMLHLVPKGQVRQILSERQMEIWSEFAHRPGPSTWTVPVD